MLLYVSIPFFWNLLRHTVDASSSECDSSRVYLDYLSPWEEGLNDIPSSVFLTLPELRHNNRAIDKQVVHIFQGQIWVDRLRKFQARPGKVNNFELPSSGIRSL